MRERGRNSEAGIALSHSSQCWRIPLQTRHSDAEMSGAAHTGGSYRAAEGTGGPSSGYVIPMLSAMFLIIIIA